MSTEKSDRRVKYTRMVLRQSLLELMKDNPIAKISVTDICKIADVNRGTFYSHYNDPYDLLNQIEDELFQEIVKALENISQDDSGGHLSYSVTPDIFVCIYENSDICSTLLGKHGDTEFIRKIIYSAQARCFDAWAKMLGPKNKRLFDYLFSFIANGSVSIIQIWIENGMKETPKEIADIVNSMANEGIKAFLLK